MNSLDEAVAKNKIIQDNYFCYMRSHKRGPRWIVKYTISIVVDCILKLFFLFCGKPTQKHNYEISICTIFKNEAPFIKEWIEYHLLLGVDHFYLYNNNSEDDYLGVIEQYIEKGCVTLIDWPDNPGQISAYKHFYNNYRNDTHWVSFLDCDEFICPLIATSIKVWIKKFEKFPVIMMYWKMFGTSGRIMHDYTKSVIEQYFVSWPKLYNVGKLFYNTQYDVADFHLGMMHTLSVKYLGITIPPINIFGKFVMYGIHRAGKGKYDLQVNHYWSKSYQSYEAKHKRGDAAFGNSPRTYDYFLAHENRNTSFDFSIMRFIIQLKHRLNFLL
ncbi:MAG: glycosyltransferase family 92 protein [Bacteroidales bacterium]|nr:glycosyltransferase family 92 protein [Bacteroidales bacterium]